MDGRHGVPTRVADVRTPADDTASTAPSTAPPTTVGWPWFTEEPTGGAPVARTAREEQAVLHARRAELVRLAAAAVRPDDDGVPDELADDLGHLVDFLAAAVFVGDPSLFDAFVRWVGSVTIPTGLRLDEVGPVLDALADALADSPRTAALLRGAHGGLPTPVA